MQREGEVSKEESTDAKTLQKLPAVLVLEKELFDSLNLFDTIKVYDTNNKKAKIRVLELTKESARCIVDKKVFIDEKSELKHKKRISNIKNIEPQTEPIRVFVGDELIITQQDIPGYAAKKDEFLNVLSRALISCTQGGILQSVRVGDRVFIDDGKIGLEVIEKGKETVTCKVLSAKQNGTLIKEEKGINFPDSSIKTPALTQEDKENIKKTIDFVDSYSISFCQTPEDVKELQNILRELNKEDVGIITKIETKQAVHNMPDILRQLLQWKNSGVMIARGDLAIEVGFENLPHVQEALLDICDAAHMPVIWATQVLESKMKNNLPSRAEVTDAAMSSRAECVMLNKGPFTFDTIDVLRSILHDMHALFKKNKQLLQKEHLWNS